MLPMIEEYTYLCDDCCCETDDFRNVVLQNDDTYLCTDCNDKLHKDECSCSRGCNRCLMTSY